MSMMDFGSKIESLSNFHSYARVGWTCVVASYFCWCHMWDCSSLSKPHASLASGFKRTSFVALTLSLNLGSLYFLRSGQDGSIFANIFHVSNPSIFYCCLCFLARRFSQHGVDCPPIFWDKIGNSCRFFWVY